MSRYRTAVSRGLIAAEVPVADPLEQLPTDEHQVGVDREAGIIYGVSAMQAVEALGHDVMVDDISLQQVAEAGNAARLGIKCRFTHPGMCEDGMGSLIGRVRNFRVLGDKVVGDLHLSDSSATSPKGDLRAYVLDLAEEDPSAFGMSVVVEQQLAWKLEDGSEVIDDVPPKGLPPEALPFLRILKLHAVDVVDEPAANRDGLFAAFGATTNADAAQAFAQLDAIRDRLHLSLDDARSFLDRYFAARATPEPQETPMHLSLALFTAMLLANPDIAAELTAFASDPANADADEAVYKTKIVELKSAAAAREVVALRAELAAEKTARAELQTKYAALSALKPGHRDPGGDDMEAIEAARRPAQFTKAQAAAGEIPEAILISGNYELVDG